MDLPVFDPRKILVTKGPTVTKPVDPPAIKQLADGMKFLWRTGGLPAMLGIKPETATIHQLNGIDRVVNLDALARSAARGLPPVRK